EGPAALTAWLGNIIAVDSLPQALQRRHSLAAGESVITRDGVWIGRDWLRVSRDEDAHAGVLERESEIRSLTEVVAAAEEQREAIQEQLEQSRASVGELEQRRDDLQVQVNQLHRAHSELNSQHTALRNRLEQTAER